MNTLEQQLLTELTNYRQHSGKKKISKYISNIQSKNIDKLTISDIDIISIIAKFPDLRSKDLLQYTNVGQSAISKITNKLVNYQFIEKYNRHDNKKDAHLILTKQGQQIADIHKKYHQEKEIQLTNIISKYSKEELERFTMLLSEINILRGE